MTTVIELKAPVIAPDALPDPGDLVALTEAWRQAHYAAQAVSEIGKLWGEAKADDSHSALAWDAERSLLTSVVERGGQPLSGALAIRTMRLGVNPGAATTDKAMALEGMSFGEALKFVLERGREVAGEIRQESVPAPDLPEHELAQAGRFAIRDPGAFVTLEDLYAGAASMLEKMRESIGEPASEVQCWPHHFDLALLVTLERDQGGAMTKTIGVGLTPPDTVSESGYFYVSPWDKSGTPSGEGDIGLGSWHGHMAVLALDALQGINEGERRSIASEFVALAFNCCAGRLLRG